MVKYIFCILFGTLMALQVSHILNESQQEFCAETSTKEILSSYYPESSNQESLTVIKQSYKEEQTVKDGIHSYKSSDCILWNLSLPRNFFPLKVLRFNTVDLSVRILKSSASSLPEKKQKGIFSHTNLAKYSYRYYVYTLECMLI